MKICWDNLEKIIKISKDKRVFYINGAKYYFHDCCEKCGEPFIGTKKSKFCSNKCKALFRKNKIRYDILNEKHPLWKGGITKSGLCWYTTYAQKIEKYTEVRRAPDNENILEVKCKYCGKWFKPIRGLIKETIRALNKIGDFSFYCSNECKKACPVFRKRTITPGLESTYSNEVQIQLRKLVLERDNWTCQKCNLSSNTSCVELHCHHINPVKLDPIESADIDNCITLCVDCHYEAHKKDGCGNGQLGKCIGE